MKKRGRYYQLLSNTLIFALGNVGSKFVVFLLMPLYTNMLTAAEYGVSELVITGANLLIPFVSVSIQDAVLRFTLDKNNNSGEIIKNTVVVLSVGSVLLCLLYPVISLYGTIANWSIYLVVIAILYMIRNAFSVYMKAVGKTKLYAIDSLIYTIILMLTSIIFLTKLDMGLKGYFDSIILSTIISIVFLSFGGNIVQAVSSSKINIVLMKEMLVFSLPMVFNTVSWWVINSSDKIMIEYFISADAAGVYSVASKMPSLLTTITSIFNQAWIISSVSEYDTTKDKNFFSRTFSAFNCTLVLFASIIVLIIKPFMNVYVGAEFTESWKYVPLLLLGSIFQSYATFFGAIYTSAKKNVSVMTTTFIAAGINIVLNCLLIPWIKVQGAVIATAVAYFVVFVFRMLDSRKHFSFPIDYARLMISLLLLTGQSVFSILNLYSGIVSLVCFILQIVINYPFLCSLIYVIKQKIIKKG